MELERFGKLKRNKFLLFWCRFFVELNALQAIIQLFYLHRGLNISEIFYLGIAWSLASLLFDVPTSILADRWGKKKTIILGVVVNILANLVMLFSYGFVPFFVVTFMMSLSFSFLSGVEEAFLYETLKEMKQESGILKTSGKLAIAAKASKMLTPLVGALIATGLSTLQFNILLGINCTSSVIALLFTALLTEPKKEISLATSHLRLLGDSFKCLWVSPILKIIVFNKTLVFIACFVFYKFYQGVLVDLGVSVLMLGLLYPIFNILTIFIFSKTEYIFKKINRSFIFEFPVWIGLIGGLIFAFSNNLWLSYFLSVFLMITGIIRDPFFTQQIQWRLKSANRSTTNSVMGLLKSVMDIPILLSVIALMFFRIRKEDILSEMPT